MTTEDADDALFGSASAKGGDNGFKGTLMNIMKNMRTQNNVQLPGFGLKTAASNNTKSAAGGDSLM